jgi:hypothetical protein
MLSSPQYFPAREVKRVQTITPYGVRLRMRTDIVQEKARKGNEKMQFHEKNTVEKFHSSPSWASDQPLLLKMSGKCAIIFFSIVEMLWL